jgi:hypothetical protein
MTAQRKARDLTDEVLTCSIPAAGRMAGLSRQSSYQAAARGDMGPLILLNGRLHVNLAWWRSKLRGEVAGQSRGTRSGRPHRVPAPEAAPRLPLAAAKNGLG